MKEYLTLYALLAIILVSVQSAYQSVNWPHINAIKSGDHKLLLAPMSSTVYPYNQTYGLAMSAKPNVVLSIRDLKIDQTVQKVDFTVAVNLSSISTTQFTTILTITNITISNMYYIYICIVPSYANTYFYYYSEDLTALFGNGTSISTAFVKDTSVNISSYSQARVIPYVVSFALNGTDYSVNITGAAISATQMNISISSNSLLTRIQYFVIYVDAYTYQIGYYKFLDYGVSQNFNSGASSSSSFTAPSFNYYNAMAGVIKFQIPKNASINFYYNQIGNSYLTDSAFTYLALVTLQWRERQCPNTSYYYAPQQQKCFDSCSNSSLYTYGQNQTYKFCAVCSYKCLSCSGDGVSCSSCDNTYNRTFVNATKSCNCVDGLYDGGFKQCLNCSYTCLTCTQNASTCLTCTNTRTLTSNACNCNISYFDSGSNSSTCLPCDTKCLTCLAVSTNCTSCKNSTNRIIDIENAKCPCKSTFTENGTQNCIAAPFSCSSPCITCQVAPTNCTSCNVSKYRALVNSACICMDGFTAGSVDTCVQICGDGKIMLNTTQCDDGNTNNGDGCSSSCQIETGFTCTKVVNSTSKCTSITGYTTSLQSLVKDPSSNQMTAVISINPMPSADTVPTLANYKNQLQIISYYFDYASKSVVLNILINQEPSSQALIVSFAQINTTASVALVANNNLAIKPYSQSYFSMYQAEMYLVWIYIASLWALSFIFIIFFNFEMLGGIVEMYVYTAIVWVGVEGQQIYNLLYYPLKNLRYIFGFNLQIGNAQCLLEVFNIGAILFTLPAITFFIIVFLNKRAITTITTKTKKFVFYDLTYSWLIVNGILVIYGLAITTSMKVLNGTAIAGIAIGILYLGLLAFLTYRWYIKEVPDEINPTLQSIKSNLFKPKGLLIYLTTMQIICFVYISIKKQTNITSIIMIAVFIIIFIIFAFANIFINKMRYMLNLVSLVFVYGCILLINTVNSADWGGIIILALIYIQLIVNFLFLYYERSKAKIDMSSLQSEREKIELGNIQNPNGDDHIEQNSQNKTINNAGNYENQFTVYEPTVKKPQLEINIPAPQILYQTNGLQTALKSFTSKSQRQKFVGRKSNLGEKLLTPKQRNKPQFNIEQQLMDIGNRQVNMDSI